MLPYRFRGSIATVAYNDRLQLPYFSQDWFTGGWSMNFILWLTSPYSNLFHFMYLQANNTSYVYSYQRFNSSHFKELGYCRNDHQYLRGAYYKQESPANAKGTRDSSACMKAHCEQM